MEIAFKLYILQHLQSNNQYLSLCAGNYALGVVPPFMLITSAGCTASGSEGMVNTTRP